MFCFSYLYNLQSKSDYVRLSFRLLGFNITSAIFQPYSDGTIFFTFRTPAHGLPTVGFEIATFQSQVQHSTSYAGEKMTLIRISFCRGYMYSANFLFLYILIFFYLKIICCCCCLIHKYICKHGKYYKQFYGIAMISDMHILFSTFVLLIIFILLFTIFKSKLYLVFTF